MRGRCIDWGASHLAWLRTEEEVDALIAEMMKKGKGKYITQSVVFRKTNPRHMELLKKALMSSESFGGFTKELLAEKFSGIGIETVNHESPTVDDKIEKKDTGNFL
jgi:hypothetical protein